MIVKNENQFSVEIIFIIENYFSSYRLFLKTYFNSTVKFSLSLNKQSNQRKPFKF